MDEPCCDPTAPIAFCVYCGKLVHTCERAVPVETDGCSDYICGAPGHEQGVELSGGRGWVCSEYCSDQMEIERLEDLLSAALAALCPLGFLDVEDIEAMGRKDDYPVYGRGKTLILLGDVRRAKRMVENGF